MKSHPGLELLIVLWFTALAALVGLMVFVAR